MFDPYINVIAIVASGVIHMIIGALWYGPIFGKQWMALVDMTEEQINNADQNRIIKTYGVSFLNALIMAFVLAYAVDIVLNIRFGQVPPPALDLITTGLKTGFFAWLGFIATTLLTNGLYEDKPIKLWTINAGYWLMTLVTIGAVIALWR